jgi:multiple sugar transport system ATP-binding protein
MVLLGPSGCGKTTFLRIICGLEKQTSGDLLIGGNVVNDMPPRARGVAMMFQSYGLYPHYTVRKNIAFPLRTQRVPGAEIAKKVEWASQLLGIGHLLDRRPRQLSGGERQRVALARALVREPTALLLDEPLSNLDAKLRASARQEIKQFQQRVGITTIYVTHDQVEAMGMGDRIAVIDRGQVRQVGTPAEIYDDPADRFVATFVGSPPMNLLERNGGYLGFRPENFLPRDMIEDGAVAEFSFRVDRSEYLGSERIVYGAIEGHDATQVITAKLPPAHVAEQSIRPGEWHPFAVRDSALRHFDRDGKRASRH